jgi:phage/plasmid-associated DNA primase
MCAGAKQIGMGGVRITKIFDQFLTDELYDLRSDTRINHKELNRQTVFLLKYRNRRPCENAITQSKSAMLCSLTQLDADPDLIAVQNGILNLRTGTLLDFDPSYYITRQLGIAFDSEAACPLFESFLETSFEADKDLISYVQGILGYGLTPEVTRQELYFFTVRALMEKVRY